MQILSVFLVPYVQLQTDLEEYVHHCRFNAKFSTVCMCVWGGGVHDAWIM